MKKVTLYGNDRCTHCVKAKAWLEGNSVPFTMKDTSIKENFDEFLKYNEQGIPLLIITDLNKQTEEKQVGFSPDSFEKRFK